MKVDIKQNPKGEWGCPYIPQDPHKTYSKKEIYPNGMCPWLYYSTYPYMLGLLFGADFKLNEQGDAWVGCPAKDGCKTHVKKYVV